MQLSRGVRQFVVTLLRGLYVMESRREDEPFLAWIRRHWRNILWGLFHTIMLLGALLVAVFVVVATIPLAIGYWWIVPAALFVVADWLKKFWADIGLEGHLLFIGFFFLWILGKGLEKDFQGIHRRLSVIEDLLRGRRNDF